MLKLEKLQVILGKGSPLECKVLNNLDLTVQKGDFIVVVGGNGAGKSTLFNVISGALKPDSGKVSVNNQDITKAPQRSKARLVSKVMQDPRMGTMEHMTLFENMVFALKRGQSRRFMPFFKKSRKHFFQEKLELLKMGLEDRLNELVSSLSGGQRQALSLIMALLFESKLLLLDEITAALDPHIAKTIMELTAKLVQEEKRTCILTTHNMADAITYGNRLLILKEGYFTQEINAFQKKNLSPLTLASTFSLP